MEIQAITCVQLKKTLIAYITRMYDLARKFNMLQHKESFQNCLCTIQS